MNITTEQADKFIFNYIGNMFVFSESNTDEKLKMFRDALTKGMVDFAHEQVNKAIDDLKKNANIKGKELKFSYKGGYEDTFNLAIDILLNEIDVI